MLRNFDKLFATKTSGSGTVVHIGAGICSELPEYQRLKFEKIQLVEAHSDLADQLAKRVKNVDHINVSNIVVAAKEEAVPFFRTNNPRFDSLKKLGVIKEYFPNICVVNEETVNAVSLDILLKTLTIDSAKENVLVLELQGAETDVLGSVTPANLQLFSWLIIKTSEVVLYGNQADNASLSSVLKQFGFELVFNEELIFPFCVKIFRRNDAEIELCQAKQNVKCLESEVDKAKAEAESGKSELTSLRTEVEARDMTLVSVKGELENSRIDLESVKLELESRHASIKSLETQLAAQTHGYQEKKDWAESLNKSVENLKAELAEKSRSTNLGQKMLAKAQVDLDHLRESYAEKAAAENELVELVKELREKLMLASKYYFKLQQEHPELLTSVENTESN